MVPAHLAELQKIHETCRGLGLHIPDAQFAGTIILSMPSPSWDPVIGTLTGVLDPKMIISQLFTEWTQRLGSKPSNMDGNVVFQSQVRRNMSGFVQSNT